MSLYLDTIGDDLSIYISEPSENLLGFIKVLSQKLINMCCVFAIDIEIWNHLKKLYKECKYNKGIINVWQSCIEKTTRNLILSLTNISQQDFDIISLLNPFKELPIMKEYILQILLNAFKSTNVSYNKLKETILYLNTFEVWMRLFEVIDIKEELSNKVLSLEYSKSKG